MSGKCKLCGGTGRLGDLCSSRRCSEVGLHLVTEEAFELAEDIMLGMKLAGKYVLIDHLGSGGAGRVYLALQDPLGRLVAVKLITSLLPKNEESVSQDDVFNRFLREAKAMATVSHPNIVSLVDFGEAEVRGNRFPFLVMEYLEGRYTLDMRLSEGRLTYRESYQIFSEILKALSAAHSKGVVHRDLKPENVMMVQDSIKLMDFGLAKAYVEARKEDLKTVTFAGIFTGTPMYAAPEQCLVWSDEPTTIDHRADFYALGIMLYEAWTGDRDPFDTYEPVQILRLKLSNPDFLFQKSEFKALDEDKQGLIRKAMAPYPKDRFYKAEDIQAWLEQICLPKMAMEVSSSEFYGVTTDLNKLSQAVKKSEPNSIGVSDTLESKKDQVGVKPAEAPKKIIPLDIDVGQSVVQNPEPEVTEPVTPSTRPKKRRFKKNRRKRHRRSGSRASESRVSSGFKRMAQKIRPSGGNRKKRIKRPKPPPLLPPDDMWSIGFGAGVAAMPVVSGPDLMFRTSQQIGNWIYRLSRSPALAGLFAMVLIYLLVCSSLGFLFIVYDGIFRDSQRVSSEVVLSAKFPMKLSKSSDVDPDLSATSESDINPDKDPAGSLLQLPFYDRFENNKGWGVVDEGVKGAPSRWLWIPRRQKSFLEQRSNIYDQDPGGEGPIEKLGTLIHIGDTNWSNYTATVDVAVFDDDSVGLIVYYVDQYNYYRLSLDRERSFARLVLRRAGEFHMLAEDQRYVGFTKGVRTTIKLSVYDGKISAYVNDKLILSATDNSLPAGGVGLYSWGTAYVQFFNLRVEP